MISEQYDVVIIGGGINGVGVAQASAARGYRTLLLERNEQLGLETSSSSSKLIHGGLRYLESYSFSLVQESLQERELLLKLAPDLVKLQKFNIPLYRSSARKSLTLHLGLSIYAILSGLKSHSFYHMVKRKEWKKLDGLKTKNLTHVFQYQDAQTDDHLLTRVIMNSATSIGAEWQCHANFIEASVTADGVDISYELNNQVKNITTKVLVNATGPWVSEVNKKIKPKVTMPAIELVQGSHLVMNQSVKNAYYVEAPQDGRVVFLLPWKDKSLLGTTEHIYQGEPKEVETLKKEKEYLLHIYRHYFPHNDDNVFEQMAGLRVLPESSDDPFSSSRETIIHTNDIRKPRVVSIIGGKITVYRKTAQKVMEKIQQVLPERKPVADTRQLKLELTDVQK